MSKLLLILLYTFQIAYSLDDEFSKSYILDKVELRLEQLFKSEIEFSHLIIAKASLPEKLGTIGKYGHKENYEINKFTKTTISGIPIEFINDLIKNRIFQIDSVVKDIRLWGCACDDSKTLRIFYNSESNINPPYYDLIFNHKTETHQALFLGNGTNYVITFTEVGIIKLNQLFEKLKNYMPDEKSWARKIEYPN